MAYAPPAPSLDDEEKNARKKGMKIGSDAMTALRTPAAGATGPRGKAAAPPAPVMSLENATGSATLNSPSRPQMDVPPSPFDAPMNDNDAFFMSATRSMQKMADPASVNPRHLSKAPPAPLEMEAVDEMSQMNIDRRAMSPDPMTYDVERGTNRMNARGDFVDGIGTGETTYENAVRRGMSPEQARSMGLFPSPKRNAPPAPIVGRMTPEEAQAELDAQPKGVARAKSSAPPAPVWQEGQRSDETSEQFAARKADIRTMNENRSADVNATRDFHQRRTMLSSAAKTMFRKAQLERDPALAAGLYRQAADLLGQSATIQRPQVGFAAAQAQNREEGLATQEREADIAKTEAETESLRDVGGGGTAEAQLNRMMQHPDPRVRLRAIKQKFDNDNAQGKLAGQEKMAAARIAYMNSLARAAATKMPQAEQAAKDLLIKQATAGFDEGGTTESRAAAYKSLADMLSKYGVKLPVEAVDTSWLDVASEVGRTATAPAATPAPAPATPAPATPEKAPAPTGGDKVTAEVPTQASIDKLKADPSLRDAFDKRFGPGAAAKHLGS